MLPKPTMKHLAISNRRRPLAVASSAAGFTLLEMMVVVSIFSLVVGLVIQIPEMFLSSSMIEETREEMRNLQDALLSHYSDVESFPAGLVDLVDPNNPPSSWLGPYLVEGFSDAAALQDSYREDVWLGAYQYTTVSANVRRLTSYGPDGVSGGGDDLVLDVDAGPAQRAITRRELDVINNVIATYNSDFLFSNTLSTTYSTLLDELQTSGYLPNDAATKARFLSDAWGQTYTTAGLSPVLEVFSQGAP